MTTDRRLDELCINTIRMLAIDAVDEAKSGHPGMPLGAAPMAYALWDRPITRECPDCQNPFLVEKFTKNGTQIRCPVKGCGYKEQGE